MNEIEKELFVNNLKQQFRNNYAKDIADEMCSRLDMAKKNADMLKQVYNLYQQQRDQFKHTFMALP